MDGWTGFCYRRGCGRLGVGVCFEQGHSLDGFEQKILCMAVTCLLISTGMRRGNQGCLGPAVPTKMGTVRTDLCNQSRVKGLRQLQAGHCASAPCFVCIVWLFHINFLYDARVLRQGCTTRFGSIPPRRAQPYLQPDRARVRH